MRRARGADFGAAGGPARHIPVLRAEALEALNVRADGLYLDGTFGAGGYSRALIERGARVVAIDRDPDAIAAGQDLVAASHGRLTLVEGRFGDLDAIARRLGAAPLDGVVLDIGVSSMQFDEADRGFSLRQDAPLDMRMEGKGRSAADILREDDEQRIADILFHFGEERAARRIARAVVADRTSAPYVSTLQLAEMIARVAPARPGETTHPATRAFQALRIAVNDELGQLLRGLEAAESALRPGGRLVVVTFIRSKTASSSNSSPVAPAEARPPRASCRESRRSLPPTFVVPSGQPILPDEAERAANPRARSAKLRFGERTAAPARGKDEQIDALTRLPPTRPGRG